MVFSSAIFLYVYLPVVLGIYFVLPARARNLLLLISSIFFYTWGEGVLVGVMLGSAAVDYLAARVIDAGFPAAVRSGAIPMGPDRTRRQRAALAGSVVVNLTLLGVFKYFNFALDNCNAALVALGLSDLVWVGIPAVVLPLGISFYTFQSMSYTIDVYRGHVRPARRFIDFACFVTMFPQLVAGPIVRYRDVEKELIRRRTEIGDFAYGVRRFVIGLGKKLLIADVLQGPVDRIFALPPDQISPDVAWIGAVFFCLQLYYDFSGYSDMAIGLGRMLGFRFPENFRYPYIARTVAEFWTRWHITLSAWLRDYVFVSLGGYRVGRGRAAFNLILTFLLCGLWHGASWNFVIFGASMGVLIALERLVRIRRRAWFIKTPVSHVYMVLVIVMHMVLFRAETLSGAWVLIRALWGFPVSGDAPFAASDFLNGEILLAAAVGVIFSLPVIPWLHGRWTRFVAGLRDGVPALGAEALRQSALLLAVGAIAAACSMKLAVGTFQPFIYFRF